MRTSTASGWSDPSNGATHDWRLACCAVRVGGLLHSEGRAAHARRERVAKLGTDSFGAWWGTKTNRIGRVGARERRRLEKRAERREIAP